MAIEKTMTDTQLVCAMVAKNEVQYTQMLPAHIPVAKFIRIAQGAIAGNKDLLKCTKQSLYLAVEQAAKDGLIIDGKQAAMVVFNKKVKNGNQETWVSEAKYMPMVGGLMQLARNSGQISTPVSEIVYENDKFLYHIKNGKIELDHSPNIFGDRGRKIGAYSSCVIHKTGEVIAEVMTADQIQKVRGCSKAKDSLMWTTFEEEGWKKTVFRRMFKRLPSSSDRIDNPEAERFANAVSREDDLYNFEDDVETLPPVNDPAKETKASMAVANSAPIENAEEIPFETGGNDENLTEEDII